MIKRFNITVLDGQCLTAMSAHSEGSYVRYADIAHLLEEKTLEQHREEFEEWCDKEGYDTYRHLDINHEPFGVYGYNTTHELWEAWKAARGVTE